MKFWEIISTNEVYVKKIPNKQFSLVKNVPTGKTRYEFSNVYLKKK